MTTDDLDSEERHKVFADGYKKVESELKKPREWWLAKHAAEGFCRMCGGTSSKKVDEDDILVCEVLDNE